MTQTIAKATFRHNVVSQERTVELQYDSAAGIRPYILYAISPEHRTQISTWSDEEIAKRAFFETFDHYTDNNYSIVKNEA